MDSIECPVCFDEYDSSIDADLIRCVIPCKEGHVICLKCFKTICQDPLDEDGSKECWILGNNCRQDRPHSRCPMCRDVFHLPNDTVEGVLTVPENEADFDALIQRRRQLRREILFHSKDVESLGKKTVEKLEHMKSDLNEKTMNCRVAKISGGATSIVGGTLFIIGAALAIPTFGAALPLMIAGAAVSGAGGATATGASIADLIINKGIKKETEELWARCEAKYGELCDMLHQLQLQDSLVILGVKCATSIGGTAGSIAGVIRLATIAADISQDTAQAMFRIAGAAGRGLHIFGMVFASALLVFDIVSVVWNSIEVAQKEPAAFSAKIDEVIQAIKTNLIDKVNFIESQLEDVDKSFKSSD